MRRMAENIGRGHVSDFPASPSEVDVDWLEAQIRRAGGLTAGRLRTFRWASFGTGQMGTNVRFEFDYEVEGDGPLTLIGKFPSTDEGSLQTAAAFDIYRKEVLFYRELLPLLDVRAPVAYAAEVDGTGTRFVLLLEDLGPTRTGDQLKGCTLEDARGAIRQAAAFHAQTRNNRAVTDLVWLGNRPESIAQLQILYPQAQQIFCERYSDVFPDDLMTIAERFAARPDRWWGRKKPNPTLVHGDFRLDNMLFDVKGGAEPIAIVDWAGLQVESGLTDIGYFLGCGLDPEFRQAHETELLDLYCEEMTRRGSPMRVADIWDEYRIGALHGLATAIFSIAFVKRTERGDENLLSMARGAAQLALDHDSVGALLA
ncbi:hypothetical protein BH10PSE12_BH10PSE12_22960 [soil metagenome]